MKNIDEKTKLKIIAVISALIPQAKIILFGSRAHEKFCDLGQMLLRNAAAIILEGVKSFV